MKTILFENAQFHTGVTEDECFRYMLVESGRIKALRNERPEKSEYARVVDLGGGHAFPCLIDAHVHLLYSIVLAAMGFDVCRIDPEGHSGVLMGEAHERNLGKITDAISSAVTPSVLAKGIANIENLFDLPSDHLSTFRLRATFYEGKAWKEKRGTVWELVRMMVSRGHRV